MEHPPSPSDESSPSRRGSHLDHRFQGISPHPQNVQLRRESGPVATTRTSDAMISQYDVNPHLPTHNASDSKGDALNEQSHLLRTCDNEEDGDDVDLGRVQGLARDNEEQLWNASDSIPERSKSTWYLILLTLWIGGLQLAWAVELSNGSPYLLSLGISKSLLALVWIAGPLSGTLVQPYVGIKSDRCRLKYGKRRPFIVGGAVATVASLMLLAWTKELIGAILGIFRLSPDSQATKTTAIVFAVIMVYVLDFSINVIQAGIRALIVDNAPSHQQDIANAWANRITSIGNIIAFLFGYADLPKVFWFFGNTQFKVLCVIASIGLILTVVISAYFVKEKDPRSERISGKQASGVFAFFKDLYSSIRRIPRQISRVCQVQLLAWIGWFPFLFYATTYVGQIYVNPIFKANPNMTPEEVDEVWNRGTRVGTFALMIEAVVTFAASVMLPWFVTSSYQPPKPATQTPMIRGTAEISPTTQGSLNVNDYFVSRSNDKLTDLRSRVSRFFARRPLEIPGLTLRRAWMISHILFAILTLLTFAVHTATSATILVAFIGVPWAMTSWAPYVLIAAEIRKRDSIRRGLIRPPRTLEGEMLAHGEDPSEGADQAGTVLGILNVSIAAPQILATLVSSAIFKALQKPRGAGDDDSVAWVLRFGGCAALIAAYLTMRVGEEGEDELEVDHQV